MMDYNEHLSYKMSIKNVELLYYNVFMFVIEAYPSPINQMTHPLITP